MKIMWGNSLWQLILQSDTVSCLVMLFLLGASILCWTILIYKFILFKIKRKQLRDMIFAIKEVKTFDELLQLSARFKKTLPGDILDQHLSMLKNLLSKNNEKQLTSLDWQLFQDGSMQIVSEALYAQESYLPIISTTAAISPLLGLFGTVWGLVHSFIRISEQQTADITVVAPGIAEALMTTIAGLIVAIPAYVIFNYLSSQIRYLDQQLTYFSDRIGFLVHRIFVKS